MKGGPSVWTRLGRLTETVQEAALRRDVFRIAAEYKVDPVALLNEARIIVARSRRAAVRTEADLDRFIAQEQGMSLEEYYQRRIELAERQPE
jgi:hypothetical protein